MQRFLIFIVLLSVNYTQSKTTDFTDEATKAVDACIASTGIDPDIVENAFGKSQFVPLVEFKCFLKCMFITLGDMNEAGELFPDNMKLRSPPGLTREQAHKIVDECTTPEGSDACDIAYNSAKCMYFAALIL